MQDTGNTIHPLYAPQKIKACFYEIVSYGGKFAVVLQGEVKVCGLDAVDLEKAQSVLEILNDFIKGENAG